MSQHQKKFNLYRLVSVVADPPGSFLSNDCKRTMAVIPQLSLLEHIKNVISYRLINRYGLLCSNCLWIPVWYNTARKPYPEKANYHKSVQYKRCLRSRQRKTMEISKSGISITLYFDLFSEMLAWHPYVYTWWFSHCISQMRRPYWSNLKYFYPVKKRRYLFLLSTICSYRAVKGNPPWARNLTAR